MGKTITIPSNINYSTIESNSDVGTLSDNGDGTFDAADVNISTVKSVLGESTYALSSLCTSSAVNRWSLFKPDRNKVDSVNNQIIYSPSAPHALGDFAAYDHNAAADYMEHSSGSKEYPYTQSGVVIFANWVQNQMNWYADLAPDNVSDLILIIKDQSTGNIVYKDWIPLENKAGSYVYHTEVTGVPEGTYTCEFWFGQNSGSGLNEQLLQAHVPDSGWQWTTTINELQAPSCYLSLDNNDGVWDPDNDGTNEITLDVNNKNVAVDDSYSISFYFRGQNPDIIDGKIYASLNGGSWQLIKSAEMWLIKDQLYSYSGTLPFDVYYEDSVAFFLSTLIKGDLYVFINQTNKPTCNLNNHNIELQLDVTNSYSTDTQVDLGVDFSPYSDFSSIQTLTSTITVTANSTQSPTVSGISHAMFDGETKVYARARITAVSDSKDYNSDWSDVRSDDVYYTNGGVNTTYITIDSSGTPAQTIDVTTYGTWTTSKSDSWIIISGGSGTDSGSFDIECEPTSTDRAGTVTVTTPYDSYTITVNQTTL